MDHLKSPNQQQSSSSSAKPSTCSAEPCTGTSTASVSANSSFFSSSSSKSKLNSPSAEQKRWKFQRSGGSKHTSKSHGESWSATCSPSTSRSKSKNASTSNLSANTRSKSVSLNSVRIASLFSEAAGLIMEDEKPVLAGVPVRAGQLPALVHICIRAFDYKGEILDELENFPGVLFLMHQWFCPSSSELASLFLRHYKEHAVALAPCQDLSCHCQQAGNAVLPPPPDILKAAIISSSSTNTNTNATTTTNHNESAHSNSDSASGSVMNSSNSSSLSNGNNGKECERTTTITTGTTSATTATTATTTISSSSSTACSASVATSGPVPSSTSAPSSTSTSFCSGAKAKIRMLKRGSGSSSNTSSSTSSGSLTHLSQEELQNHYHHNNNQQQQEQQHPPRPHQAQQQRHHHPPRQNQNQQSSSCHLGPIKCRTERYRASVCQALRYWIRTYPIHFDADDQLKKLILDFAAQIDEDGHEDWARLLDLSDLRTYDWLHDNNNSQLKINRPANQSTTNSNANRNSTTTSTTATSAATTSSSTSSSENQSNSGAGAGASAATGAGAGKAEESQSPHNEEVLKRNRKVSLIFDHLEPDELAQHITCFELRVIRRITFLDFKTYAESGTLADNPMLEESVAFFNSLSQWIQIVVLSRAAPNQRAEVIAKFVKVAKELRALQNFNSLMGVVGSLGHSCLARLYKTMDLLPTEERKQFVEFAKLVSSSNNFRYYRRALGECRGFKIPILGVHLKDLISLHTALPDITEHGMINFRKMTQLSLICRELHELQEAVAPGTIYPDVLNTLKVSLEFQYSDDELYELSLLREARASDDSVSPTRGPSDQMNYEPYESQVQVIVESVFRKYDINNDGFISREEFQCLSNNYPAIDAFFILDENRDGKISRIELEKYLLSRKDAGTSHNFHEQTYFKPTFCVHCSGLLWGIIRQGYKCKQCGVNAHKYCKDYMLYECKTGQLFNFPSPGSSVHSEPQVKRRGFRLRKKSSSQSESGSPPSPKYFASLEQLSLSTESTEMPGSTSTSAIHQAHGGSTASLSLAPGSAQNHSNATAGKIPKHHQTQTQSQSQVQTPQHQQSEASSTRGTKSPHFHPHSTPKGNRRFSILSSSNPSSRACSSVPSSPKLGGLSSISLFTPCRTLFGHHNHNQISSQQPHQPKNTTTLTTLQHQQEQQNKSQAGRTTAGGVPVAIAETPTSMSGTSPFTKPSIGPNPSPNPAAKN